MRLFHHAFLLVPLLAAIAGAEPPPSPRLLDGSGSAASPRKSETLLPARATHRVSVRVSDLHWAAIENDVVEVKRLITTGADLNARETLYGGERPLHWAAIGGSGGVRALIAAGASLEARDDDGETALREALRGDDSNFLALRALLAAGANPQATTTGWAPTALHEAVLIDHAGGANAVRLLRMFGADPNAASADGVRPLHLAVLQSEDYFWGWLLNDTSLDPHQRALDVNAKDNDGQTALHYLANRISSAKDVGVLRRLLDYGADINAVDNSGATPLDWTVRVGYVELANELRAFGGGTGSSGTGGGSAVPPAPPPAPPPFQPQPVEVALGENGGTVTLRTTEAGGFTLEGEAFTGGAANPVRGADGRMYVLTLDLDGTWSAALVPNP